MTARRPRTRALRGSGPGSGLGERPEGVCGRPESAGDQCFTFASCELSSLARPRRVEHGVEDGRRPGRDAARARASERLDRATDETTTRPLRGLGCPSPGRFEVSRRVPGLLPGWRTVPSLVSRERDGSSLRAGSGSPGCTRARPCAWNVSPLAPAVRPASESARGSPCASTQAAAGQMRRSCKGGRLVGRFGGFCAW